MSEKDLKAIADRLDALTSLIARAVPPARPKPDFDAADAFVWQPATHSLLPVERVNRVELSLLKGIDRMRDILVENTERFARGLPANNALLWGARGMGKSSLVKAVHASVGTAHKSRANGTLKLVEIHREDIESLPDLMALRLLALGADNQEIHDHEDQDEGQELDEHVRTAADGAGLGIGLRHKH